jgi:hypothetical protein
LRVTLFDADTIPVCSLGYNCYMHQHATQPGSVCR